jgi:hypothetical protein
VELGLTTTEDEEHAYMQCVDPGKPYTEGGTVIFKCQTLRKFNQNASQQTFRKSLIKNNSIEPKAE